MVKRLSALLLLALCCAPLVQAQECTALVQEALELTEQLCGITERNQACYGNIAIESVPQADAAIRLVSDSDTSQDPPSASSGA